MKKNKLKDIKLNSVDLVKRGANQDAHIVLCKSDNTPEEPEHHILKKAFDYLKTLFSDDGEPDTIAKSDIAREYDSYALQLCKSFDSIMEDDELNEAGKAEKMQKSIKEFADFMGEAAPMWAGCYSVMNSNKLSAMIAKAENINNHEEKRKESDDMDKLSNLTPEEQETLKSLQAKLNGGNPAKKEEETPESWIHEEEAKKSECKDMKKSDLPQFVLDAINKSDEFIKAQEVKEMQAIAKKYEVLGEKADELGQQLYDLKKANKELYDSSIAILDRQVDAIEKSGLFTEIGKSGATSESGTDTVAKVDKIAKSYMDEDSNLSYHEAMVKAWEAHPELAAEYEGR